jgi:hypothetical protein
MPRFDLFDAPHQISPFDLPVVPLLNRLPPVTPHALTNLDGLHLY